MTRSHDLLLTVAARLNQLEPPVVFVGGITTHLLLTDPAAPEPTATKDVDVIIQVRSRADYLVRIAEDLRALGAREDGRPGAPMCRWLLDDVIVDIMPTDAAILGFSSRWYNAAVRNAEEVSLEDGTMIRRVSAPYFLATKAEAFLGRGAGDLLASKDIEDVIAVLDGRLELVDEVRAAPPDLRAFVADQFTDWLGDSSFQYAIEGYLQGERDRLGVILDRVAELIAIGTPAEPSDDSKGP